MTYKIILKGKEVPVEFSPDEKIVINEEIHLDPFKYGSLDLVLKKEGVPGGEVIIRNGIFSFMKHPDQEAYIVDCRDYQEICKISDIQELKASEIVNE